MGEGEQRVPTGPRVNYLVAWHPQRLIVILAHVWLCLTYPSHKIKRWHYKPQGYPRKTVNHFNLNPIYLILLAAEHILLSRPLCLTDISDGRKWIISLSSVTEAVATSLTR